MIYTITFNPAIDYVMKLDSFVCGEVNRSKKEEIHFGGKGINVSLVLKQLGIDSKALGFCAGFTGKAIEDGIRAEGILTDFIHLSSGNSRINVKLKADKESEINGQGPAINADEISLLFAKLDALTNGDTLVLAGSVPSTLPKNTYEKILEKLNGKGIRFIVDATNELLVNVLKYKPFLIKPNNIELGEIFGVKIKSENEIVMYAKKLQQMGAKNVLVSMAGDGSILIDESGNVTKMGVCKPYMLGDDKENAVVNSVGAGDSMVAGFIAGYNQTHDYSYALKLGTACGGATAFSSGLAKKDLIDKLLCEL